MELDQLIQVQSHYALRGETLIHAAMAGGRSLEECRHYPSRDVRDPLGGALFFYHTHPVWGDKDQGQRGWGEEHGHFHVFMRHPEADFHRDDPGDGAGWFHLVAVSLSDRGVPLRLFATNQWVTGETWLPAERYKPLIDGFTVSTRGRLAPLARWVQAFISVYRPEIVRLAKERDQVLRARASGEGRPIEQIWGDSSIHALAIEPIQFFEKLESLE